MRKSSGTDLFTLILSLLWSLVLTSAGCRPLAKVPVETANPPATLVPPQVVIIQPSATPTIPRQLRLLRFSNPLQLLLWRCRRSTTFVISTGIGSIFRWAAKPRQPRIGLIILARISTSENHKKPNRALRPVYCLAYSLCRSYRAVVVTLA